MYMPTFLEHVKNIFQEYCFKAVDQDKAEKQTLEAIEQMFKKKKEILSNFPEDVFHFINDQLNILGP